MSINTYLLLSDPIYNRYIALLGEPSFISRKHSGFFDNKRKQYLYRTAGRIKAIWNLALNACITVEIVVI